MLNKIFIMGRLTKDVELRSTANGISVATFTLAVDRDYQNGSEKRTDFINCVAWRNSADFVNKYFHKGSMAIVEGSLQSRQYENKEGNKVTVWEVVADAIRFGESKRETSAPAHLEELDDEGDIPF